MLMVNSRDKETQPTKNKS